MLTAKLRLLIPHLAAITIFITVSAIFFSPQFSGKKLSQSDVVSYQAASQEMREYAKANGKALLWTNAMFGGMPSYQISNGLGVYSPILKGQRWLALTIPRPAGYFLAMMIGYYLLMISMGINSWVSVIASIAYSFATYNIVLWEAGHTNKLRSFISLPLITAGLFYLLEKKRYLAGSAFFTFGLALNLSANHVQMTYYFLLCVLLLGIIYLVKYIREKSFLDLGKVIAIALLGLVLAIGPSLANIWSSYEYGQETMRGKPILSSSSGAAGSNQSSSSVDGLAYDYAMQWSHAGRDLWTLLAPRAVGGSNGEKVKSGALHQQYRLAGYQPDKDGAFPISNLYWGGLPFTSGPAYFGAIILFLFVMGAILVKGPFKWWIVGSVLLILLLSLGKNLDWFQRLFFDYFPLYNKWRSPNSAISIASLFFPLLGAMALSRVVKGSYDSKEVLKAIYIAAAATGGLALLMAGIGTTFFSFLLPSEGNLQPQMQQLLIEDRKAFFRADFLRSAGFISLAAALLWAYTKGYLQNKSLLIVGIGVLAVGDTLAVGRRYIKPSDFVTPRVIQQNFEPREVDQQILNREPHRGAYRVLDLSVDPFNSASASYYHNQIGGYSAAKLQRMQDIIDYHLRDNNLAVLNMLNTRYIISQDQQLQINAAALGNAWLVDNIRIVDSPEDEINALSEVDPGVTAVVLDQEFNNYIGAFMPEKNGSIELIDYDPQNMVYQFESNSEQLAVFSEVWYSPEKGWKAYIDNQEVPFIRANYILRALRVPAGQHEIRFEFAPRSVKIGGTITKITGWFILYFFLLVAGWTIFQYLQQMPVEIDEKKAAVGKGGKTVKRDTSLGAGKMKKGGDERSKKKRKK